MNIKKIVKLTAIIGGGIIVIGMIVLGVTGYWPIAMVGGTPITYASFKDNFMMADHFYRSNIMIAGEDGSVMDTKEVQRELQRGTMDGLIERILIEKELEQRYVADDLDRLIEGKLSGFDLGTDKIRKGIELQSGLTPEQFRELVLLPKAQQELLEGNLTLQNGTFLDWVIEKKAASNVSIFVPSMYWEGSEVKLK